MIDSASVLRQLVSDVASGLAPASFLQQEVAQLGEGLPHMAPSVLRDLVSNLELLFAERSSGHLDDQELASELRTLAPLTVDYSTVAPTNASFVVRTLTAGSSTVTNQVSGQFPAAGRRPAAARA